MSDTEERLAEFDGEYETAPEPEKGKYDPLPDGKYQVNVEEICIDESKAGNLMLKWELRVISGQFAKRKIFKNSMLQTPENMTFLKGDLGTCGIKLAKLSELPSRLTELLDIPLEVFVKNKKEGDKTYSNVYFNSKLIDAGNIPDDQAQKEYGPEDDIPF